MDERQIDLGSLLGDDIADLYDPAVTAALPQAMAPQATNVEIPPWVTGTAKLNTVLTGRYKSGLEEGKPYVKFMGRVLSPVEVRLKGGAGMRRILGANFTQSITLADQPHRPSRVFPGETVRRSENWAELCGVLKILGYDTDGLDMATVSAVLNAVKSSRPTVTFKTTGTRSNPDRAYHHITGLVQEAPPAQDMVEEDLPPGSADGQGVVSYPTLPLENPGPTSAPSSEPSPVPSQSVNGTWPHSDLPGNFKPDKGKSFVAIPVAVDHASGVVTVRNYETGELAAGRLEQFTPLPEE